MNGAPQRLQTVPPPTPYETARKGVVPFLDPLPRFEASQPGNILRIFERGRRDPQEIGIPNPFEDPGKPRAGSQRPRPGHPEPHRPRLRRPAQDPAARPDPQLPRHQRPPRRLPLERLHRLPRDLRQRPLAGQLRPVCRCSATTGSASRPTRPSPQRAGPPDQAPVRHGNPHQPVHRLPRPPRHQRHEQLPRLHVVGRGDRRRAHVSQRAEASHRRGIHPVDDVQPRRDRRAG